MTEPDVPPLPPTVEAARRGGRRMLLLAFLIAAALLLAVLFAVPVPQAQTYRYAQSFEPGNDQFNVSWTLCPAGAQLKVAFTSSNVEAGISMEGPNGTVIWTSGGLVAGLTDTLPACGSYAFIGQGLVGASITLNVTVSYSSPLL